jgi:ABC-2 type transport system permease protein
MLGYFGFNKAIHTRDKKQKRKLMALSVGVVILMVYFIAISFFYSYQLGTSFAAAGAIELLPAFMMASASLMVLITTIYKVSGVLFNFKDYDMIMSLPVKTSVVVASRMVMLYTLNILFVLLIMVPAGVVYALKAAPDLQFYPLFLLTLFMIPLVPIVIASAVGVLIHMAASRFRHTNIINLILTIAALLAFMAASSRVNTTDVNIADIGGSILKVINQFYPLTMMYVQAVCFSDVGSLLLYAGISILIFGLFAVVVGLRFNGIQSRLSSVSSKRNFVMGEQVQSTPFMALYRKELKRYISSPLYVLNTGFGIVMFTALSFSLMFFQAEAIGRMLEIPQFVDYVNRMAPLVVSVFIALSCTTACAISLEGKSLWVIKSSPLKSKTIYDSKIAVNLTITLPAIVINGMLLMMTLKTGFVDSLLLFIVPAVYAVFIAVMGLVINLHFPLLEWVTETTVIKQSAATLISMLVGLGSIAAPISLVIYFPELNAQLVTLGVVVLIGAVGVGLYTYLNTKGEKLFLEL